LYRVVQTIELTPWNYID